MLRAYKYVVSPWLTGSCRFVPTCADYTAEAIVRHGLLHGSWLGARRLGRCHPFGGSGHDPVPPSSDRSRPFEADPTDPIHPTDTIHPTH